MTAPPRAPTITVLVVEGSHAMQEAVTAILGSDPEIEVLGTVDDGASAPAAVARLRPQVVTMNAELPRGHAAEAVERILGEQPTPVVLLRAETPSGMAAARLALDAGAVDVVSLSPPWREGLQDELRRKVKVAARVRPLGAPAALAPWTPCVVVAASSGGPAALLDVVPQLPHDLPASVVVIQHLPQSSRLVQQLAARSPMAVTEARDGERLRRGVVYVAPGGRHLTISADGRVMLRQPRAGELECPSANLALASVAAHAGRRAVGVILTGIGRDGAAGARAVRAAGGLVVAQDERSSVVYGMPRAAVEVGAVDAVVALSGLAAVLDAFVRDLAVAEGRTAHAG